MARETLEAKITLAPRSIATGEKQQKISTLSADLLETAQYIVSVQRGDGAIPWFVGGKCDPWDHIESAMALSIAGFTSQSEKAYQWMRQHQLSDGSWLSSYFVADPEFDAVRQTHFIAYIATGVWHHFAITGDEAFLATMSPCVEKAIDCILRFQDPDGDIAWAFNEQQSPLDDALLTGCCSILRSLDCAIRIATHFNREANHWRKAAQRLAEAIRCKPERFDRTWPSKRRFAMDWYYPVLSGALTAQESRQHLKLRWEEFVEPDLGCRCVSDEPWVTMAESSELVIALAACGETEQARSIFNHIQQWRHAGDGGYWTGYVFRDDTIWPQEKTTWTAAAVILAADALNDYSSAAEVFTTELAI